ncbi:MAG TPA: hypothetical protein VKY15_07505, partial [Acidimicrobiales bacterium]|nr:hypothetical protein [Acidimicrobiales bacterium]
MVAALAGVAGAGIFGGHDKVGSANADGILLPTNQRVEPLGHRLLVGNGRLIASSVSPNGRFLAASTWELFNGFLTVVDLKANKVVQQIGTGVGSDKTIGDGTVAPDPPLWSPDGSTLWWPQSSDLVRFSVSPAGSVSQPQVINLQTQTVNQNTNNSTTADLPCGMALASDGSKLYVALNGVNELGVIDTSSDQLVQLIRVGNAPRQVVLAGDKAFVSNEGGRSPVPGDFTNQSYGTPIVASGVTGAATTGTVSEVDLAAGREVAEIPVGLQPTAELLAPDGTLMVANSNDDSLSLVDTSTAKVIQTVNVNPLPGSTVGSYPNAIAMPDRYHLLVSIGRDNALALYGYRGPRVPLRYLGLLPTDFYPVQVSFDQALDKVVVTNDKGIGSRGQQTSVNEGPGTAP